MISWKSVFALPWRVLHIIRKFRHSLTNLMDGIVAVFFVYEGIENTDVLFSLFLVSGPSPVWEQKASYWARLKRALFVEVFSPHKSCVLPRRDKLWWHRAYVWTYLCLNVCTPKPRLGSSGHTATYSPILCLTSAPSHLEHIRKSCTRSAFVTRRKSQDYSDLIGVLD